MVRIYPLGHSLCERSNEGQLSIHPEMIADPDKRVARI